MLKKGIRKTNTEFEKQVLKAIEILRKTGKADKDIIDKTNYRERKKKEVGRTWWLARDRRQRTGSCEVIKEELKKEACKYRKKGRLLNVHKMEAEIKLDKELADEIEDMRK